MRQNSVRFTLCAWLFALCIPAEAQQAKYLPRIGYLSALDPARESARSEAIWLALRDLGYTERQNIATEYRYAEGNNKRLPELAAELVRLKVDIIVAAGGDPGIQAAKNATKTIPIVMVNSPNDPVEAGHVESLARPGGNVTGLTLLTRELNGKRMELLKETVPRVARVAVLYDPAIPGIAREVKEVLDGPLSDDVLTGREYEEEIWLKYGGRVENQINGCVEEFAEVTVIDMPAKQFEKVSRRCLMLCARGQRHGQFSFENLIPVAIVGQKDVVLIGENNLPFRNVHGSRHSGLGSFEIVTTEVF
jgi:hypothetical protein